MTMRQRPNGPFMKRFKKNIGYASVLQIMLGGSTFFGRATKEKYGKG